MSVESRSEVDPIHIQNALRRLRHERGLSQQELAERAGVTRQTVGGIEAGRYLPSTAVSLRMARALDCRVEDLFWIDEAGEGTLSVHLGRLLDPPDVTDPVTPGRRVTVARVGDRWVAHIIPSHHPAAPYLPADGLLDEPGVVGTAPSGTERNERGRETGGRSFPVPIQLFRNRESLQENILFIGCDPALGLLAARMRDRHSEFRLSWLHASSQAALQAVARGEAHVAGTHLYSEETDEFNLPFVRHSFPGTSTALINLAHMEEGFLVRPGNPLRIRRPEDLARPDVRLINREKGAGARKLLDRLLGREGISPVGVTGYDRLADGHLAVAQAVAMGAADVGVGSRSAAIAHGLHFNPLSEERFDLAVPLALMDDDRMGRVIDTLGSRPFRRELSVWGGYQTSRSGEIIARVMGA